MANSQVELERIITQVTDFISNIPITEEQHFEQTCTGLRVVLSNAQYMQQHPNDFPCVEQFPANLPYPIPAGLDDGVCKQIEAILEYIHPENHYVAESYVSSIVGVLQERINYFSTLSTEQKQTHMTRLAQHTQMVRDQQTSLRERRNHPPTTNVETLEETYRRLNAWLDEQQRASNEDLDEDLIAQQLETAVRQAVESGNAGALIALVTNLSATRRARFFQGQTQPYHDLLMDIVMRYQEPILQQISRIPSVHSYIEETYYQIIKSGMIKEDILLLNSKNESIISNKEPFISYQFFNKFPISPPPEIYKIAFINSIASTRYLPYMYDLSDSSALSFFNLFTEAAKSFQNLSYAEQKIIIDVFARNTSAENFERDCNDRKLIAIYKIFLYLQQRMNENPELAKENSNHTPTRGLTY